MNKKILLPASIVIVLILAFLIAKYQLRVSNKSLKQDVSNQTGNGDGAREVMVGEFTVVDGEEDGGETAGKYQGQVLAGKTAVYIDFNKEDYDLAKRQGKIILLNFYANWCPICRGEAPELNRGFDELNNGNVIAFRVNFNDSDTDDYEKQLAEDFKITYQHTKVILKDGVETLRSSEPWDKEKVNSELSDI